MSASPALVADDNGPLRGSDVAGRQIGQNIRPLKTGEMIASYLRGKIVRGELAEGDCLPSEVELMRQFDVSRPTLREAFRILETESLIELRRGARGARIIAPSVEVAARYVGLLMQTSGTTVSDVYEARSLLEPVAAGLLATRRTPQDLADLSACADDLEHFLESGQPPADVGAWTRRSQRFHDLLMERAGNKTLALQSLVLREVVDTHLLLASRQPGMVALPASAFARVVRSYRKLIGLVEARDAAGAEAHWRTHMDVAARSLLPDQLKSATVLDIFS
jgi:GntR family transcriptional regulator, transcriptional repressor for pyruvate dehydrogenase complex